MDIPEIRLNNRKKRLRIFRIIFGPVHADGIPDVHVKITEHLFQKQFELQGMLVNASSSSFCQG